MRVETTTNNRKAMAYALADRLGAECRYMGTPTYAYRVGNLTIERDGAVTGEHLELLAVTGWLLEHGYITELIPMVEQSAAENIEEQHAEKTTPDLEAAADESITHTCVFLPLSSFTPTGAQEPDSYAVRKTAPDLRDDTKQGHRNRTRGHHHTAERRLDRAANSGACPAREH